MPEQQSFRSNIEPCGPTSPEQGSFRSAFRTTVDPSVPQACTDALWSFNEHVGAHHSGSCVTWCETVYMYPIYESCLHTQCKYKTWLDKVQFMQLCMVCPSRVHVHRYGVMCKNAHGERGHHYASSVYSFNRQECRPGKTMMSWEFRAS